MGEAVGSTGSSGQAATKKKKEKKFRADFFLIVSEGVYLSEEAPEDEDTFTFSDYNSGYESYDEEEAFCFRKKGATKSSNRGSSKSAKPKVNPNRLVRASELSKSEKRKTHVSENQTAQKNNIDISLTEKGIQRTGHEIYSYEKKSPSTATTTPTSPKTPSPTKRTRLKPRTTKEEDHPAALRYELHSENIPKGTGEYMRNVVDLQHRDLTPEDYELLLQLDSSVAPKTISQAVLSSIVAVSTESADIIGELCTICMEVYQRLQSVKSLPCKHTFHAECIDMWLSFSSPNCPLDGLELTIA